MRTTLSNTHSTSAWNPYKARQLLVHICLYLQHVGRDVESMQTAVCSWMPHATLVVTSLVIEEDAKHNDDTAERSQQSDRVVKEWNWQPHCKCTLDCVAHTTHTCRMIAYFILVILHPYKADAPNKQTVSSHQFWTNTQAYITSSRSNVTTSLLLGCIRRPNSLCRLSGQINFNRF